VASKERLVATAPRRLVKAAEGVLKQKSGHFFAGVLGGQVKYGNALVSHNTKLRAGLQQCLRRGHVVAFDSVCGYMIASDDQLESAG